MKLRRFSHFASAALPLLLPLAPLAHAGTLYWDGSTNTTLGSSDNTTTTGLSWLSNSWDNGTSAGVSWTAGENAIFGGSAASQTITAGTLTVGNMTFGSGALGAGTTGTAYTISGGTITLSSSTITTNTNTTISSTLTGGSSLTKAGSGTLTLGTYNDYSGGTTVNNGTLALVGGGSTGIIRGALTINSGATVRADTNWSLGYSSGTCVSSIAITGGTLNFTGTPSNGGTSASAITMTGGTISGSSFDWYNGITSTPTFATNASATTSVLSSGINFRLASNQATFNVASGTTPTGVDLLVSGALISAGGVKKTGTGTMQFTAGNTYSGATTIEAGRLQLSGAGTLASTDITVKNTGTLQIDATGKTLKSLAVEGGSTLALAAGAGTTTITNALTFTSTPAFTVRPGFASTPVVGTYDLLNSSSISGSAGTITTDMTANGATRVAGSTAVSGNKLVLTITSGGDAQTWGNGAGTGVWATNADLNFTGPTDGRFMTYDSVTFGNTAPGSVTLSGTLVPSAVTVNSTSNYTFTGSGSIGGSGSLTKSDSGTLTINTANSYSGGTNLNGGIVALGNAAAIGTAGTITFGGGTLQSSASNTTDYSSRFSTATGQNYRIDTNGQNVTFGTALTGTGNILTKSGAGTLTLGPINSHTGGTVVNGGTLTLGDGGATGNIRGALTINSGATVNAKTTQWSLGYTTAVTAITITDGTLNFTGTAADGGTSAGTITMTGGTISGSRFDWFSGSKTLATLASSTTSTISSGINLRLQGSNTLTCNVAAGSVPSGGSDLLISGVITQTEGGNIDKTGAGLMELSAANTFNGTTKVSAGTLKLSNNLALQNSTLDTSGAGAITLTGTTPTFGGLSGSTNLASVITSGYSGITALTLNGNTVTYTGVIAEGATGMTLTKTGSGTQTLGGSSANTYTGTTFVNGGYLKFDKPDNTNAIGGNLSGAGGWVLWNANEQIANTATITMGSGASYLVLELLGRTETVAGISGTGGYIENRQAEANINTSGTLAVNSAADYSYTGTMRDNGGGSGTGVINFAKSGTGIQTLGGGGIGYTGTTTVNGGTLKLADATGFASTSVTLTSGTLELNRTTGTQTLASTLSGAGSLEKTGAGTVTLSANNSTFTGKTVVTGGSLALAATGTLGSTNELALNGGNFNVSAVTLGYTVAKLTGNGSVTGNLTVSNNLGIGNSAGTVDFQGLSLGSGSTSVFELGNNACDLANVSGTLMLNGTLDLNLLSGASYNANEIYTLFGYTTGNLTGTFTGLADGDVFTDAGGQWKIDYDATSVGLNGGTGNRFVTVTAIPEPAAALLGGLGMLALLRRRR